MNQTDPQKEYQKWLTDPKIQQEYNQWRLKDELKNLKQLDPNLETEFNKIFGADK